MSAGKIISISFPMLMQGFGVTIEISIFGIIIAIVLGFVIGMLCLSQSTVLRGIARVYIKIFRCTPFMVQVYLAYFGLPALGLKIPALRIGILTLGLYNAAYIGIILESGIRALPKGQTEAAQAIGLSRSKIFFKILFPQTLSVILPPLTGQFLQMVKDSSVLSIVTVAELTMMTQKAVGITFEPVVVYVLTALLYWGLNLIIEFVTKRIERKHRIAQLG